MFALSAVRSAFGRIARRALGAAAFESRHYLLAAHDSHFRFRPFACASNWWWYAKQLRAFLDVARDARPGSLRLYPCLGDCTEQTPIDPVYFLQDTWAVRKVVELQPAHHHDVGSSAKTMGILAQFVPVTMVDIRPLPLSVCGLRFVEGDILSLPFESGTLESVSSLCVVEHVGLGRYGDGLDARGSERAAAELQRVCRAGGTILVSLPVDVCNKVYFNAHRAFTRDAVLEMFAQCTLAEERYQYGYQLHENYMPVRGFGTGLFRFVKDATAA